jgi:hypothetical protein
MDATTLRDTQTPLKERYRNDPGSAMVTLTAAGELDGTGVACRVRTASALVEAGLHPATGGDGSQLCSGDMLLEALVACAGVTMRAVATSLGLEVSGRLRAEGDLDFRGHSQLGGSSWFAARVGPWWGGAGRSGLVQAAIETAPSTRRSGLLG